ncbi:benzoate/H(+) symporter BenE family transporter [Pseudomonas extremaustralis]|uniref:benzoate/H(+) symporter BenE family transporter n=1 Tax=Pseudomonas extremaustralis TaxID=359110 RepID=UPI0021C72A79|nr:benzoate/H(+) symporter BenE family transporter [Pseudomonas extremaustralis]MDB1112246.1 benzoate/H(+) symporter BenE family transporter [Pseudomonas extremaustralis]MDG2967975.1 benzoate/H(+) symporter BenE family transporter [Pseudomonas extremaustralis]UUJ38786.1 benzoate/H(+) symporter BenE family transporter [Pseudomonas extremaustralis]
MGALDKARAGAQRWPEEGWSLISTGASAALIGFISTFFIVLQGLYNVGASPHQAVTALAVLCLFQGIMGLVFSLATRKPYTFAWSTPGAAILLSYNQPLSGFEEAVGAFCMAGGLMLGMALVPRLSRYLEKIPVSLSSAMLAGVLLSLAKSFVPTFEQYPLIVGMVALVWLLLFIVKPLFSLPVSLCVLLAYFLIKQPLGHAVEVSDYRFEWVVPVFTLSSFINLSIPLFVVTLFSQNIPGYLIMRNNGYATHFPGTLFVTGLATSCASLLGCHGLNLAALTAAMCAGPLASSDRSLRYIASCAAGVSYLLMALFAAGLVSLLAVIPSPVILALAALAMFSTLADALRDALKQDLYYPAVATLMVTVYFPNFFHVSSSFWGLVLGTLFYLAYSKKKLG